LREIASAFLAVPTLLSLYLGTAVRRVGIPRLSLLLVVLGVTSFVVVTAGRAGPTTASPASDTSGPPATAFRAIQVGRSIDAPLTIDFTGPMDPASVVSALEVRPQAPVTLAWNDDASRLVVRPVGAWQPATTYTVSVRPTARGADGTQTTTAFLAERMAGERVRVDSAFVLDFERPVDVASAMAAFRVVPPVAGSFEAVPPGVPVTRLVFRPALALAPDSVYLLSLEPGATDIEGAPLAPVASLVIQTESAPSVVRFRPKDKSQEVEQDVEVSVRFTVPMDRTTTRRAFTVTIDGKPIEGKPRWAEDDTVLVVDPAQPFPYGATVVLQVGTAARSATGAPLSASASATFTVEPEPPPPPTPAPKATPRATTRPPSNPAPVPKPPSGSLVAAEKYVIALMNCTRGGGWVETDGSCSSPGGGSAGPLKYDSGISDRVARPYARKLVSAGVCSHFYGGGPDDRLRAAGYTSYRWAENLGCRYYSNLTRAAINLVRFFQSEKGYNGGHWRNMMNPAFDRAGVGIASSGGNLRIVIDFYHP
jgi:uncharacterized protein YkwD